MVIAIPGGGRQTASGSWRRVRDGILESLVAIAIALAFGAFLLVITGHSPIVAYRELIARTLLRPIGWQEVLVRATPLLIVGCAVLIAGRAGIWNIGIDGQVLVGALAAGVAGSWLTDHGRLVLWGGAMLAGAIAGGLWGFVPSILRARFGINEIVTTLMFNYIAISLTSWLVKGPLRDPNVVSPQTRLIPGGMRLLTLGDTRVHVGLLFAIVLVMGVGWFLARTVAGFELSVVGANPRAARHGLIPVAGYVLAALVGSGALAGLAGVNDVLSTKGTFQGEWNPGYGLAAFALVFLARRSVAGLIPAALFLGMLSYGADVMPRAAGIAPAFFDVVEGTLLITLAIGAWKHHRGAIRMASRKGVES
ncbi:MAG: ABC transporter permease [Thermomicrobiales bacterium]